MTQTDQRNQETLLIETLLSGLDAREAAKTAGTPMLVYLADLLVQRTRIELEALRGTTVPAPDATTAGDEGIG